MKILPSIGSRALFPTLDQRIFANHASVSPLPEPVQAAMNDNLTRHAQSGVAAMHGFLTDLVETRKLAGQLLGLDDHRIALVANTSLAISSIAASIAWKPGDGVILFRGEFPSNTTPWLVAAKAHQLRITWLDADAFRTDEGIAQLTKTLKSGGIRMVAVSAVQFSTGLRMPIEAMTELAHKHGSQIFVDAIQALGNTPMDTTEVDFMASGGQKWLMGPPGTALLYVRDWSALQPTLAGWLSHTDALNFLWGDPDNLDYDRSIQQGPALFEGGTLNFAGFAGLTEAMRINLALGADAIHAHANAWIDRIEPGLTDLGFESLRDANSQNRSCILSVKPPVNMHAGTLANALAKRGISVSTPDAKIRFSPSWPNNLEEPTIVLDELKTLIDC